MIYQTIKTKISALLVTGLLLTLSGCAVSNREMGAGLGSVAGGVLGNQIGSGSGRFAATALGAMIGGWIGTSVGAELDKPAGGSYYSTTDDYYTSDYTDDYSYRSQPVSQPTSQGSGNLLVLEDGMVYDPTTKRVVGYTNQAADYQRSSQAAYRQVKIDDNGWENR